MEKRNIYLFTIGVRNKPPYKTAQLKNSKSFFVDCSYRLDV